MCCWFACERERCPGGLISCEKVRERFTCPQTFASSVLDFTERVEVPLRVGCDLARMGGFLFVVLRHVLDGRMVGICGFLLSCGDHAKIVCECVYACVCACNGILVARFRKSVAHIA